jgi:hypothetical protein
MLAHPRIDRHDPIRVAPNTDIEEAMRAKLLIDKADPRWAPHNIDRQDPKRAKLRIDNVLP